MTDSEIQDAGPQRQPLSAARTGPGEGEAYWFYGHLVVVRSPDGARPIVIEHHLSAESAPPLHLHHELEDSYYLLTGSLAVRCGDDSFVATAGDYVFQPAGVPHTFRVLGEEAVLLQTHAGAAFLDFIRRAGTPFGEGKPDPASLDYAAMNIVAEETGQPVIGAPMAAEDAARIAAADQSRRTKIGDGSVVASPPLSAMT
jgi:mannose-6-phosphate isomerase-like protein (cupin superfamily)